jgi:hypothetical protein
MSSPDEDDAQEEITSGPFCQHWGYPSDCDHLCRCGHPCNVHYGNGEDCQRCIEQLLPEPCTKFEDED